MNRWIPSALFLFVAGSVLFAQKGSKPTAPVTPVHPVTHSPAPPSAPHPAPPSSPHPAPPGAPHVPLFPPLFHTPVVPKTSVRPASPSRTQQKTPPAAVAAPAPAPPVIRTMPVIAWGAPGFMRQGDPLTGAELNATANAPGIITYSPAPGYIPSKGILTITATFIPTDPTRYDSATAVRSITVQ